MEPETGNQAESCGNCGASVAPGTELCPACGALLAAYRTPAQPAETDTTPAPPIHTQEAGPPPALVRRELPQAMSSTGPVSPTALGDDHARIAARSALVRTLAAPRRRPIQTASRNDRVERVDAATAIVPPSRASGEGEGGEGSSPTARPQGSFRTPATAARHPKPALPPPSQPPSPRRPGFIVKGSVEVALLWGLGLFLLGCFAFGFAALVDGGDSVAAVVLAMAVSGLGAVVIAFALLVALVRRDRDR